MKAWLLKLQLGRLGWAGPGLLLLALIAHGILVSPRIDQRTLLEARISAAPQQARGPTAEALDADTRLADFQRALPRAAALPQWLGRIRAAALANGLVLRSGDYKLEHAADSPFLRYRITLPVTGSYGQIRGFIGAVLTEVPAASVDDVQLKTGSGSMLDGRIRLSLFIAAE